MYYVKNGHTYNNLKLKTIILKLQEAGIIINQIITKRKNECDYKLGLKLSNQKISEIYLSILKMFYNGENVPLILMLLLKNTLISDYKDSIFVGYYFTFQYAPVIHTK